MGHLIELNDTLKLKRGAGFPAELRVGGVYDFSIAGRRLYNLKPTRVFLVEEIDGKWNLRGSRDDPAADHRRGEPIEPAGNSK